LNRTEIIQSTTGELSAIRQGKGRPVVLLHSINAAASNAEMAALADELSSTFSTWNVDLPGFGESSKRAQRYDIALYAQAVTDIIEHVRARESVDAVDVVALSLTSEFAARAASHGNGSIASLTLISPTGMDTHADKPLSPKDGGLRRKLADAFENSVLGRAAYRALSQPASIRFFLRRIFGSSTIDPKILEAALAAPSRPNAERAPLAFVTGRLFSPDAAYVYGLVCVPMMIVYGTRGAFANLPVPAALKRHPRVSVFSFETGAMPHVEQPSIFARVWKNFAGNATTISMPAVNRRRRTPSTMEQTA
jgi:pimeloyl-ACP methyl ester carboxylesterase